MKKAMLFAVLLAVGFALTAQAVAIHWAVVTPVGGATTAALVYVGMGGEPPSWNGSAFSGGTQVGATVDALPDYTVGAQATEDAAQTAGGYYMVLFNEAGQYAISTSWLSYDDKINGTGSSAGAITYYPEFPAQGAFVSSFGGWTAVPEPSTAALLCLGAAAAVLRRRKPE